MAVSLEEVDPGHFTKRASRIISNAALYNLVEDMARKVDALPKEFRDVHMKLDTIMEILRGRTESGSDG